MIESNAHRMVYFSLEPTDFKDSSSLIGAVQNGGWLKDRRYHHVFPTDAKVFKIAESDQIQLAIYKAFLDMLMLTAGVTQQFLQLENSSSSGLERYEYLMVRAIGILDNQRIFHQAGRRASHEGPRLPYANLRILRKIT